MSREVIVKPLGLVTRPNIYGQYPVGGMLTAQNLVMRAPGIIESAPSLVLGVSFGVAFEVVHDLFPLDNNKMASVARTSGGTWNHRVDTTASTAATPLAFPITFSQTGRISPARARGRVLYNSQDKGVLVTTSTSPTPPDALRRAGLPQVQMFFNQMLNTNPVALAASACAGYSACIRRIFSDGYELVSKPSAIVIIRNANAGARNPQVAIACDNAIGGWLAGDIVELYRTDIVFNATTSTDPGTTCKKIYSRTLTSGDVATYPLFVEDTTQPGPLGVTDGEGLYTNPGNKGLVGGHRQPDICQCMAVFKGALFCGDITERPQLKFQVPGGFFTSLNPAFDTAAFRTNGIGIRNCSGTVTLGSPNITGVSATHMLGVVTGQQYFSGLGGATFPPGATVASAAGTTITMSANATAGGTGVVLNDVMELAGSTISMLATESNFVQAAGATGKAEITVSANALGTEDPTVGITCPTWILEPFLPNTSSNFTIRATNGLNYKPQLTEITLTATTLPYVRTRNLLKWSNDAQPEAFPSPNETQVGTGDIIALESTRDALWIFCTDGLHRLSGAGGQWRIDTADTTLVLASPRASCVLKEAVYAYTNQGLVRVTDAGTENLSELIVGDLLTGAEYSETASIIVERNEQDEEIVIRLDATQVYVYSVREQTFTTVLMTDVTAMTYARYPVSGLPALAVGQSPTGSAPSYSLWNATNSFLAPTARFHPVFAQDPFASKQWIDGAFVFDVGSIGKTLTPAWNGTTSPAALLKGGAQYFNESRAVFGVPRRAAIGHTLAPGWGFGALSTATKMYALSMRYRQFAEQNLHR